MHHFVVGHVLQNMHTYERCFNVWFDRIPQALVWLGALEYSERLNKLMKAAHMFKTGDREEVEIRGCTIWAVEVSHYLPQQ